MVDWTEVVSIDIANITRLITKVSPDDVDWIKPFDDGLLKHDIETGPIFTERSIQVPTVGTSKVGGAVHVTYETSVMVDAVVPGRDVFWKFLGFRSPEGGMVPCSTNEGTRRYVVSGDDFADVPAEPARVILLKMPKNVIHVLLGLGVVGPEESSRPPIS